MQLFYVQKVGYVGNSLLWWRKGGHGYTPDIKDAEVWTDGDELKEVLRDRDFNAWPKEYIDGHVQHHIDYQTVDGTNFAIRGGKK